MAEAPTYNVRLGNGNEFGPAQMDLVVQWTRQGRVPGDALLVGVQSGETRSVRDVPELAGVLAAPPTSPQPPTPPITAAGDAPLSGIIPYRNPSALIGYYLGVFSLIPFVGVLLAVPAIILGIVGLVKRRRDPKVRGAAHAVLAITLGVLGIVITMGLVALIGAMNW